MYLIHRCCYDLCRSSLPILQVQSKNCRLTPQTAYAQPRTENSRTETADFSHSHMSSVPLSMNVSDVVMVVTFSHTLRCPVSEENYEPSLQAQAFSGGWGSSSVHKSSFLSSQLGHQYLEGIVISDGSSNSSYLKQRKSALSKETIFYWIEGGHIDNPYSCRSSTPRSCVVVTRNRNYY